MDLSTLRGLVFDRVLSHNPSEKVIYILLSMAGEDGDRKAILKLERRPFAEKRDELERMIQEDLQDLQLELENGIYSKYAAALASTSSKANIDLIFPATDKHVQKYSSPPIHLFEETSKIYEEKTLAYIQSLPESGIEWVYNILDGKAESDRVLVSDPHPTSGFVLLPDLKWDREKVENLYCLAICRDRKLKSLRDLRAHHVPMLRDMYSKCTEHIQSVFQVPPSKIRAYVHYHPSYYHFHVHFVHTSLGSMGGSCVVARAHLLSDIIRNLEADSQYYSSATLVVEIYENSPLYNFLV